MKKVLIALIALLTLTACQSIGITDDPKVLSRPKAAAIIKSSSTLLKVLSINSELEPKNPKFLIAQHFGYVEPDKLVLTERGRQLWRDLGLQINEHSVLYAHAQFNEVTGISMSGNFASAKFTWQWIPNEMGKALVIDSPEFKALPDDLQNKIRQPVSSAMPSFLGSNSGIVYGGVRQGTANFQLYDDGWRATSVYIF